MSKSCDCCKNLFNEAKSYIEYKINNLDIQKYLTSQDDVRQLENEVTQLLEDLNYEFEHVLEELTVSEDIEEEIDKEYKILLAKHEIIPEFSTEQIAKSLEVIKNIDDLKDQITQQNTEMKYYLENKNLNTERYEQKCTAELEGLGKQIESVNESVKRVYHEVELLSGEHELLESEVLELFKQ